MFTKPANQTTLHIGVTQVDKSAESAELFSVTAASASATVAPTMGNHSWVVLGTTLVGATGGSALNFPEISTGHVICADAISEANYSADGSWAAVLFRYEDSQSSTGGITDPVLGTGLYGLQRLQDTEDGDVSLYASVAPASTKTIDTRTSAGSIATTKYDQLSYGSFSADATTTNHFFSTWKARGLTAEAFQDCVIAVQRAQQSSIVLLSNNAHLYFTRMQASANPIMRQREKIWLSGISTRSYKGSLKWMYFVNGGSLGDVFAGDPGWAQLSNGAGAGTVSNTLAWGGGAVVIGPADGTVPWINNSFGT
jgi:hypothetical protein